MRRHSAQKGFDDVYFDAMREGAERLVAAGMSPEEALEQVSAAAGTTLEELAPRIVETLIRTSPRMLREHRRSHSRFERRLRVHWGKALDLFYAVLVCAEEMGREFDEQNSASDGESIDLVFEVLTGLHARAIRTASEVHTLLSAGFPLGALARCRTLHELAVTSIVIAESGRDARYIDLAARFIAHQSIGRYADAKVYQETSEALGNAPFSDAEMAEWKEEYEEFISRYGKDFKNENGWAIPLFGWSPKFRHLEERAGLDHLRGYYRWASHEVHSTSRGWGMNTFEHNDGTLYRLTGRTLEGLADPAMMALTSLLQTLTFLITSGSTEPPSPKYLVQCIAVRGLIGRCEDRFLEADGALEAGEQGRLSRWESALRRSRRSSR